MRFTPYVAALLCFMWLVVCGSAFSADVEDGAVQLTDPVPGELHLRSHRVSVVLNNGFATTEVNQVLANPGDQDVEATWDFPLPKEGSLSELAVAVGEETLVGEVVEKAKAAQVFEAEKSAGRDAALMEQRGFYDYRIALARVPARGEVHVRIVYYQPLDIDAGVGRYLYPLQSGGTDDLDRSFWTMDKAVQGEFAIDVTLETAFPVDGLHCPSHAGFQAAQEDEETWKGRWTARNAALDRDFVLYYRLRDDLPARVELLTHRREGDAEGTYMAVVTPGSDLGPIEHGTDWVFVLDASGSMDGEKIRMLRRGVSKALQGLGRGDRVRLVAFSDRARALTPDWVGVGPASVALLAKQVSCLQAGGSTNLHAALALAYQSLAADRPSGIILVSDGVANTGPHHVRDFIQLARAHDVRLFTFVMGNSANERLLADLATISHGFAKSVSVQDEIGAHLLLARDRMSHQAMHGVTFTLDGSVARHPTTLPSLYLGQQLVVMGRYTKVGRTTLEVAARISGESRTWALEVDLPAADESNPELERLYALQAISDLEREALLRTGHAGEAKDAIIDMALRYSLVTDHTSMIVVENDRKQAYGIGDANLERRRKERDAAMKRAIEGNRLQIKTGHAPLAGRVPAHAPSRAARRPSGGGGNGGGGGGYGGGALGPFFLIPVVGLAALVLRRRRRRDAP